MITPAQAAPHATAPVPRRGVRIPLGVRVVIGVAIGAALGVAFGSAPWLGSYGNEDLGMLGMLVIRLLKALATPLILLAVLDSFLTTALGPRTFARFVGICLTNISVAMLIGLTILNVFQPGLAWRGHLDEMTGHVIEASRPISTPGGASLDPLKNIAGYVPESVVEPLAKNSLVPLVLLAILCGAALRRLKDRGSPGITTLQPVVTSLFEATTTMLMWVAEAVPFAVLGIVAQVVGRAGLDVFRILWLFLVVILSGLLLHSLVYSPLVAWLIARKSPREYLGKGSDAVLTGLSTNSRPRPASRHASARTSTTTASSCTRRWPRCSCVRRSVMTCRSHSSSRSCWPRSWRAWASRGCPRPGSSCCRSCSPPRGCPRSQWPRRSH